MCLVKTHSCKVFCSMSIPEDAKMCMHETWKVWCAGFHVMCIVSVNLCRQWHWWCFNGPERASLVHAPAVTANGRALAELRNLCFGRYSKVWWPIFFGAAIFFLIHLQFFPDTDSQNVQFTGWKKAMDWLWNKMWLITSKQLRLSWSLSQGRH